MSAVAGAEAGLGLLIAGGVLLYVTGLLDPRHPDAAALAWLAGAVLTFAGWAQINLAVLLLVLRG